MAETFDLNNLPSTFNYDPTKRHATAERKMEENRRLEAEKAVKQNFLSLTVGEKMQELGIGERVMQEIGDTATKLVTNIVNPIDEYLKKYEHIFDQKIYEKDIQSDLNQYFKLSLAMSKEDEKDPIGQNFVYNM